MMRVQFHCLLCGYPTPLLKRLSSLYCIFLAPKLKISWLFIHVINFWILCCVSFFHMSIFMTLSYCFNYYCFVLHFFKFLFVENGVLLYCPGRYRTLGLKLSSRLCLLKSWDYRRGPHASNLYYILKSGSLMLPVLLFIIKVVLNI